MDTAEMVTSALFVGMLRSLNYLMHDICAKSAVKLEPTLQSHSVQTSTP